MERILSYLSRKFLLTLFALGGTFWLALHDKELAGWAGALAVILGFYQGSNVAQDYLAAKRGEPAPKKED